MVAGIATPVLSVPNAISVIVTSPAVSSRLYFTCDVVFGMSAFTTYKSFGRNMLSSP